MNRLNYSLLLVVITLFSCTDEIKNPSKTEIAPKIGDVTIIFKDIPVNWKYFKKDGSYGHQGKHEFQYYNGIIPSYFFPDYSNHTDTIIIKNVNDIIEIQHKYNGFRNLSYIAKPFDTLVFTYNDKTPTLKNKSRKTKKHEYDYEIMLEKEVYKNNFSSYVKYNLPSFFFLEDIDFENYKKIDSLFKKENLVNTKKEFSQSRNILDSLVRNDFLSTEVSNFYNLRIKYEKRILDVKESDYIDIKEFPQNDDHIKYSFYKEYLSALVEEIIVKNVNIKKSSNYSVPNPESVYDSIQVNTYLNDGSKKYMSFVWLNNIMSTSSNKKIESYFNQFKSNYSNENELVEYFIEKYKLNNTYSKDLNLLDEHGHKTTLQKVLDNNKDKFIYIDFWASWCAPCREAMPSSHKLREKYKSKDIVFIYLALNDRLEAWKKASVKERLDKYEHNYFIENSRTSSFVDDLEITTIPRYLLYDKNQKIIYKNAPAPNKNEIEKILNSLLIEK